MFPDYTQIKLQTLKTSWLSSAGVEAAILRLDLLHPEISGNKWFKLKYNIEAALQQQKDTLLTFGGNRSNHIAATSAAAPKFGLKSIGIIRGAASKNLTLERAQQHGMELKYISRTEYRKRNRPSFIKDIQTAYPQAYIIPEGGNNDLGIKGAEEILELCTASKFSHICCPVGTGSTLAGIISRTNHNQQVLGFCALKKANEQRAMVSNYVRSYFTHGNWEITTDYSLGGFAKKTQVLEKFIQDFKAECHIPLDFIYNAKMIWGIKDFIQNGHFPPGSKILIIHTGGLQGNL